MRRLAFRIHYAICQWKGHRYQRVNWNSQVVRCTRCDHHRRQPREAASFSPAYLPDQPAAIHRKPE